MPTNEEIWQMARMLGQEEFLSCLSLSTLDDLDQLTEDQLAKVRQCTAENARRITRSLVHEAAGSQDINTTPQAAAFLEKRLAALSYLLAPETRQEIREGFGILTAGWG